MKVLHVLSGLDPRAGGPANALSGLAAAQAGCGLDVGILATWKSGRDESLEHRLQSTPGVGVRLVGPIAGWRKTHPDVARIAGEEVARCDVVHIHALWETIQLAAARAARRHGKPFIFRPCGMLDPWSMAQGGWKKRLYLDWVLRRELNAARLIHYTTEIQDRGVQQELAARWKLRTPAIVVPNGLNLPEFHDLPPRGAFRTRQSIPADVLVVLFMSRVHPKKGLDLLIPAFAKATVGTPAFSKPAMDLPNAQLVIVGPEYLDTRMHMEQLAHQCGVGDRVRFIGMLKGSERAEALVDADLFVLPSRQENFGIVVAEAMASGVPVIVSDQVNLHDEVTASGGGEVVSLDVHSIAEALTRWLGDDADRRGAGERGRAHALAKWDWNAIARQWGENYRQIAKT